jgi:hypothetical protein
MNRAGALRDASCDAPALAAAHPARPTIDFVIVLNRVLRARPPVDDMGRTNRRVRAAECGDSWELRP